MDSKNKITENLSFAFLSKKPIDCEEDIYFCVEDIFNTLYIPFAYDFGPPSLGTIYLFCKVLTTKIQKKENKRLCFYSSNIDKKTVTNSVCLIGAYCILKLNWTSEQAENFFQAYNAFIIPYRDASQYLVDNYKLTMSACFRGLYKGKSLGWVDMDTFNYEEYSHYERIENGDFNWIIPSKFIASASPSYQLKETEETISLPTSHYISYFKNNNVTAIVRLNNIDYERNDFIKEGIDHYELYFPDGTSPTIELVHEFLKISENTPGAICVHCKQGLGRTGTLIACYLVKHYKFSVSESIAYLRLCRPGSVVGQQQHFLEAIEPILTSLRVEDPIVPPIRQSIRLANKKEQKVTENKTNKTTKGTKKTPKGSKKVEPKTNSQRKSQRLLANNIEENAKKKVDLNTTQFKKRKIADFIQPKIKRIKIRHSDI